MLRLGLGFLYDWSACAMLPPCRTAHVINAVRVSTKHIKQKQG